jgi:hypothetical protein
MRPRELYFGTALHSISLVFSGFPAMQRRALTGAPRHRQS